MLTVRQLLDSKSVNRVWALGPEKYVIDALQLMEAQNIGAVLVMENEKLLGIFSERDYARKGILQGRNAKTTPVTEVMTAGVISISPEQTIEDCMQLMTGKKFRHLPVVDNGRVIGLLSIGDIVNAMLKDQEAHIKNLEQYITGY